MDTNFQILRYALLGTLTAFHSLLTFALGAREALSDFQAFALSTLLSCFLGLAGETPLRVL